MEWQFTESIYLEFISSKKTNESLKLLSSDIYDIKNSSAYSSSYTIAKTENCLFGGYTMISGKKINKKYDDKRIVLVIEESLHVVSDSLRNFKILIKNSEKCKTDIKIGIDPLEPLHLQNIITTKSDSLHIQGKLRRGKN